MLRKIIKAAIVGAALYLVYLIIASLALLTGQFLSIVALILVLIYLGYLWKEFGGDL